MGKAIEHGASPSKEKRLEHEAVRAAKSVGKAKTTAANAVAEVKAADAAKAAEQNPTPKEEKKMVVAAEQMQTANSNHNQNKAAVKAVRLVRQLDKQREKVTEENKKAKEDA